MTVLRIGTRASDLARKQTQLVCDALMKVDRSITFEIITLATDGDLHPDRPIDANWPIGSFVGAIEQALLDKRIDVGVHSYKDLPSQATPGLVVAATPLREAVHDVLLLHRTATLDGLQGLRIGTSSSRRAAQMRMFTGAQPVPIRGNVPTRIDKISRDGLDGVVLAAAGLRRLNIRHPPPQVIVLPLDRFVPAPSQGALAVQTREDAHELIALLSQINDEPTSRAVQAERALLAALDGGCSTPVGAVAFLEENQLVLRGQLFSQDCSKVACGEERGSDPIMLGEILAVKLRTELETAP